MKTANLAGAVLGAILKVVFVVVVVYLVYTGASTCYDYGYRIFTEPAVSAGEGRKITVTLTSDMSATEIGTMMQEKGLTRDGRLFALQYLLSEYKKDWQPGTYELSTAMTAEEMMEVMAGQTESTEEESVETIDNGSALTGETQPLETVAQEKRTIETGSIMIIDERMSAFIDSLDSGNPAWLNEIEKYALDTQVPIIRRSMQSLLKFLLTYTKPKSILEVGTAIGFSALLMSEYAPADCPITTIEKYEKRIPIAKDNFRKAGREDRITLLEGDATEILKELEGSYDIIFMDAAKGQYINFLPDILRLLSPGGLLISDNVLQDGDIIESRFAVTRRNRTIHARMREYLYELKHHPGLETVILPVGDGVTLSTKAVRGEK